MSFVTLIAVLLILIIQYANCSFENSNGNIHVMKNEIEKAMEDCGENKDSGGISKAEFERKAAGSGNPTGWHAPIGRGEVNPPRRVRNIDVSMMRRIHRSANEKRLDGSNSGEWDYGEAGRERDGGGRSWDDPKDDRSVMDNIYSHNRRNTSYSHLGNNDNSSSGAGKSVRDQNSTRLDQGGMNNNFDSRGARMHPSAGFRKLMDDRVYKSMKDLNLTTDYYDPFMTRGIRSAESGQSRQRRYDRLTKTANEKECLSQCVFTNLQIVDDRGVPTEGLFIKLLQDSITSQQSRLILEEQLTSCFRELSSESEDNACSYSNSLDRCMGLEIKKRKSLLNENANATIKST